MDGAKGLKTPQFLLKPPPPDFCVIVMLSPVTTIIKCHHRRPTSFNCELQKKTCLAAGLRPDPLGELTALPTPLAGFKGYGLWTHYAVVSAFGAD